jgi:hypothetical protein
LFGQGRVLKDQNFLEEFSATPLLLWDLSKETLRCGAAESRVWMDDEEPKIPPVLTAI